MTITCGKKSLCRETSNVALRDEANDRVRKIEGGGKTPAEVNKNPYRY
jgi:hypothetical protein